MAHIGLGSKADSSARSLARQPLAPGGSFAAIHAMHLEHVFRQVDADADKLVHGGLLQVATVPANSVWHPMSAVVRRSIPLLSASSGRSRPPKDRRYGSEAESSLRNSSYSWRKCTTAEPFEKNAVTSLAQFPGHSADML